MENVESITNGDLQISSDPLPHARSYQIEALDKSLKQNTIVFLDTGSGKTLIAIMLLRSYSFLIRKPSKFIAIFLVPKVVLVVQQAEAVRLFTDLKVGMYWGDMGVDLWNEDSWRKELEKFEVLVMTPAILHNALLHGYLRLDMIKLLIFDECHHASGKHSYACIMTEFYHPQSQLNGSSNLPRIFGMTASPVKSKGQNSSYALWKDMRDLENLMDSKLYTCTNESVVAEFIPFSDTKLRFYGPMDIPVSLFSTITNQLNNIMTKLMPSLKNSDLIQSVVESVENKLSKIQSLFRFCLNALGVWMALKAAEFLSCHEAKAFYMEKPDFFGDTIVKYFCRDVFQIFSTHIPLDWSIGNNMKADVDAGFLTTKVICLIELLMEYRDLKGLRCIIFVERIITAIVLKILLTEIIFKQTGWKTEHIAGNNSGLHSQTRKLQNKIVEDFREGIVNIIVATSILEEGLDVQKCNLVIRFDQSVNVSSFIQSRGRARMPNSDFILMLKSGDRLALDEVKKFLACSNIMREQSLKHISVPCEPLDDNLLDQEFYQVESTRAKVTLSSSISLLCFYCSRLPSDRYFKPYPRFDIDMENETCKIHLPKSCPLRLVKINGGVKLLKQRGCLEACKQLHKIGALTDNLVPEGLKEKTSSESDMPYDEQRALYFPPELVSCSNNALTRYYCYIIEMKSDFHYDIPLQNIILLLRSKLECDVEDLDFNLVTELGNVFVRIIYIGAIELPSEHVLLCRKFQFSVFKLLMDHKLNNLSEVLTNIKLIENNSVVDYMLLPSTMSDKGISLIDWKCIRSFKFSHENLGYQNHFCPHTNHARFIYTKNGHVCHCVIQHSLVYTPHNGLVYCIDGFLHDLNAKSLLNVEGGKSMTYNKYYESQHGIKLQFQDEILLKGRQLFPVENYLNNGRSHRVRESRKQFVELPAELCCIMMSPISIATFYSFSFLPSIMHFVESLLIAVNLKRVHLDQSVHNISIRKVLEAITTKKCQQSFHLESLETLGDSFLKYAACQQLFKSHKNHHEGLLSNKKDQIISNAALSNIGCHIKLPGFIRNECFDPQYWIIPGEQCVKYSMQEDTISPMRKIYVRGTRRIKRKTVADVVEALIGAYLSSGGENAAISYMRCIGIQVDLSMIMYERHLELHPERLLNIKYVQSVLNYQFNDPVLLVEALTHGSYMIPEIPTCYQRLEFLGDAVLDYLMTIHLYRLYPQMSPGLLTDMRSACVNNDCYALSSIKSGLFKHILHCSVDLHKHICRTVFKFEELCSELTFGWDSELSFPKVLGDIIESLAGAIYIDSQCNKKAVFDSIRPLLEPLVTPSTVKYHPVRELIELCQKLHYTVKKPVLSYDKGKASITVEVEAKGIVYKRTCTSADKKTAKKLACRDVLRDIKEFLK